MRVVTLLLAALAAIVLTSCRSPSGTTENGDVEVHAQLLRNQRVAMDGKEVGIALFPALLKTRKVPLTATIRIAVPADMPSSALADITTRLTSVGYRKILFTRPRQMKATVGASSPGPAASPAAR